MTALPRALAHWEAELSMFPHDLALALGAWVGRLHLAIGPWAEAALGGGEPDGLAELSRRGPYDRLLASEWLLADELPDEFLRRAASREHLFLSSVRRSPTGARSAVALFDAGPSQLGAPRIAHLALLIVLGRRALTAGARFGWGVLQRPGDGLHAATDASAVHALLDARTSEVPTDAHREAWSRTLGAKPGEVWLVGGERGARVFGTLARGVVTVDDPLAPERRTVEVRVEHRGRHSDVELELPENGACARLLRDPFSAAAPAPATGAASRGGRIALPGDGRRLVVETREGFASWGLPNSPRGGTGPPRKLALGAGESLLAVGHRGRRLFAVATRPTDAGGTELVFHRPPWNGPDGASHGGETPAVMPWGHAPLAADRRLGHAMVHVLSGNVPDLDLTFHDGRRTLVSVTRGQPPRRWHGVLGATPVHDGALAVVVGVVGMRGDTATFGTKIDLIARGAEPTKTLVSVPGFESGRAWFGSCEIGRGLVGFALDPAGTRVQLVERGNANASFAMHAPEGTEVIGVHQERRGASLVIVERGRREIALLGLRHASVTLRASGAIADAHVAARGGMVVWRTEDGWIEAGSLLHEAIVMRIPPAEDA